MGTDAFGSPGCCCWAAFCQLSGATATAAATAATAAAATAAAAAATLLLLLLPLPALSQVLLPLLLLCSAVLPTVLARLPPVLCRAGQEGKAKHAKAKHETSYKEMAIYALQQVG